MSTAATVAAWIGAWIGVTVLLYAVHVVSGRADDPRPRRLLVEHGPKLAHLDRKTRERAARRIVDRLHITIAAIAALPIVGFAVLVWLVTR